MKLMLLADIHGNYYALEECIRNILSNDSPDGFIFLGDYCTDFPDWHETINLIKDLQTKYQTYIISGNRENIVIKYHENINKEIWNYKNTNGINLLGYNKLTESDLEFIYNLPEDMVISIEGTDKIYATHTEPSSDVIDLMKNKGIKTFLVGHSHVAGEIQYDDIKLYNPGSVGMTDLGKVGANYGYLEWDNKKWNFTTFTIPYNYQKTISTIVNNDIIQNEAIFWGHFLIASIITGYSLTPVFVREFYRLGRMYLNTKDTNNKPNYSPAYDRLKL